MSKKLLGLATMFGALYATSHGGSSRMRDEYLPKETEEQKKAKQKKIDKKLNESKGLKEFFYNENSLWALNQKSADKKAIKKGWI